MAHDRLLPVLLAEERGREMEDVERNNSNNQQRAQTSTFFLTWPRSFSHSGNTETAGEENQSWSIAAVNKK